MDAQASVQTTWRPRFPSSKPTSAGLLLIEVMRVRRTRSIHERSAEGNLAQLLCTTRLL
jgi:hypothetical protein